MDILDHVIGSCTPAEWVGVHTPAVTREDYDTHRYRLFDISEGEEEYTREIEAFRNGNLNERVIQLQRVQNPFQLGRFLLRREQKKFRREQKTFRRTLIEEVKYYHPLKNESQLTTALEYNMDVRRYGDVCDGQKDDRNPLFYNTPKDAFDAIPYNNCSYILVCIVLDTGYEGDTTSKKNDTEYMPIYIVKLA